MCGRYTVLTEDEIIEIREMLKAMSIELVKDSIQFPKPEKKEVYPTDISPVIMNTEKGLTFESIKWGFRQFSGSGVIINARCETLRIRSTFSRCLTAGRCVIPAGAFFEWGQGKSKKLKYLVKDKEDNILFMAGLYRNTAEGREYVIITKESTGVLQHIHSRSPVILRVNQIEDWLSGKLTPEDMEHMDYDVKLYPYTNSENQQQDLFNDADETFR